MNETQVKLIEEYGVIVLPDEIDQDAYMFMVEAMFFADSVGRKWLRIFCQGMGGESNCALAIADMIRHRGRCVGLLPGQADSCHGDIFMACQKRYVFPLGRMGIHATQYFFESGTKLDDRAAGNRLHMIQDYNRRVAELYADGSSTAYDAEYWLTRMLAVGASGVCHLSPDEMVAMGLARPVSELRKALTPVPSPSGRGMFKDNPYLEMVDGIIKRT